MSDYSDSMLTISMTGRGSLLPSSIRKSVAQLILRVGWATFEELGPGKLSFPYRVEGGARVSDRRLGSLGLIFFLGSSSAYPRPLSCDYTPVSVWMLVVIIQGR